jgi:hypothetical protein
MLSHVLAAAGFGSGGFHLTRIIVIAVIIVVIIAAIRLLRRRFRRNQSAPGNSRNGG